MRALLLAAGLGTRLKPVTDTIPKCLVPIRGRPLLDHWLDLLLGAEFERVLVNTHYLADVVRAHVEQSPWRDRIDLVHEEDLLGTGGTIVANRSFFGSDDFLVAHADNLTDFDANAFVEAHRQRPANTAMTMLAFRTDDPSSCGILELDALGLVIAFHEKVANPPGDLANAAAYILTPEIVAAAATLGRRYVDFSNEVIPQFLGRIYAVETLGYYRDIGNPASLARARAEFRAGNKSAIGLLSVKADATLPSRAGGSDD
jgi:mannose-1-phosphate guanylyltransferase